MTAEVVQIPVDLIFQVEDDSDVQGTFQLNTKDKTGTLHFFYKGGKYRMPLYANTKVCEDIVALLPITCEAEECVDDE